MEISSSVLLLVVTHTFLLPSNIPIYISEFYTVVTFMFKPIQKYASYIILGYVKISLYKYQRLIVMVYLTLSNRRVNTFFPAVMFLNCTLWKYVLS